METSVQGQRTGARPGTVNFRITTVFSCSSSWAGNSAITGHVYDADGQPGVFHDLQNLNWGDNLVIQAYGQSYVYEVRSVEKFVQPEDTNYVYLHEEFPWLTLITCKGFDEESNSYRFRVVVRAVQTRIQ